MTALHRTFDYNGKRNPDTCMVGFDMWSGGYKGVFTKALLQETLRV